MLRNVLLPLAAACAGFLGLAGTALASDAYGTPDDGYIQVWKPYVIEKNCVDHFYKCKVRMDYAPFQRSMVARPGSYWYQKPFLVYRYGDFKPRAYWHHHRDVSAHVAWCSAHYRTYDPSTNLYKGKGYDLHRCHSPYAWR